MIFTSPNDCTQVSTDSDMSANANLLEFKVNFAETQKEKSDFQENAQREIFADQKPKEKILREFNQMRQQKMKNARNKKR